MHKVKNGDNDASCPKPKWPTTTRNGTHLFFTFMKHPSSLQLFKPDGPYTYVWGADQYQVEQSNTLGVGYNATGAVLTKYIPFSRGGGVHGENLTWWQENHPSWVLYRCDKVTPAYWGEDPNIPFDISNPDVVRYQVENYVVPAYQMGYHGMAMDNVALSNAGQGCGVWEEDPNNATNKVWKKLFSGSGGSGGRYSAAVVQWMKSFYTQSRKALNCAQDFFITINYSLCGISFNDPRVEAITQHTDGILAEEGFTDYGSKFLRGHDWTNVTHWVHRTQQLGIAHFSNNEWGKSLPCDFTQDQQSWLVANYLISKGNTSSINYSPIQVYGYPVTDWLFTNYSTGVPLEDKFTVVTGAAENQQLYFRTYSAGLLAIVAPFEADTARLPPLIEFCSSGNFTDPWGAKMATGSPLVGPGAWLLRCDGL